MRARALLLAISVLTVLCASSLLTIPVAQAAAPSLTNVSLDKRWVTAQQPFVVNYLAQNVPDGGKVIVQRRFGAKQIWKDVVFVASNETSVSIEAPTRGKYTYQVVISKDHKTLVSSVRMTLYSFGVSRLRTVLGTLGGTQMVNGVRYHYDWKMKSTQQVSTLRIRKQTSGSCRWIDFTTALTTEGATGKVRLSQANAATKKIGVTGGGPITSPVKWHLTGHAFAWTYRIVGGLGAKALIAGQASCWTRDWKR